MTLSIMMQYANKIALVYSGQPRHVKECHSNHIDTFYKANPNFEIDVFAHIWYDEKKIGAYYRDDYKKAGRWDSGSKECIMDNWKPKGIIFEKPKEFSAPDGIVPNPRFICPANHFLSMFYSLECANTLKKEYENKNNFKYDCVVRLRTDEVFLNPIVMLDYNLSSINVLKEWAHIEYGLNDHFAFGSSELMDKYSDVYTNFEMICKMGAAVDLPNTNPECLLGYNAQIRHKLPITKNEWQYKLWSDYKGAL